MSLPRRPELTEPVPNNPFSSPEVYEVRGPYWNMKVDGGLSVDSEGSLQLDGKLPIPATSYLYGPNGWVGVGAGLVIDGEGNLNTDPCDLPPYGCRTDVDTSCVTNFSAAWFGCTNIVSFPLLNTSSGISFTAAWSDCPNLAFFPLIDTSSGIEFLYAWANCSSLTSFPLLDTSSGANFTYTWFNCSGLTSFPAIDLSSGTTFQGTWFNCTNLTSFPAGMFDSCSATNFSNCWFNCALNQASVNNILVSLNAAGQSNGTININSGTSAPPGPTGLAAKASLISKGWTVTTN